MPFFSQETIAKAQVVDSKSEEKLLIAMKAQTVIHVATEELKLQEIPVNATVAGAAPGENIEEISKELKFISDQEFQGTPERVQFHKNILRITGNWIKKEATSAYYESRGSARKDGPSAGLVYLVGAIGDYAIPVFLYGIGQPVLATAVLILPTGVMIAVSFVALKNLIEKRHIMKLYGGRKSYHFYRDLEKTALEKYDLKNEKEILVPFGNSKGSDHFVVTSEGLIKRVWLALGLGNHDKLNSKSLKKEAFAAGLNQEQFKAMKKHHSDRQIRSTLLMEYIATHQDATEIEKLKEKYPDSFIQLEEKSDFPEIVRWSEGVTEATHCKDLIEFTHRAPQGAPASVFMEVWEKVIVPSLIENFKGFHVIGIHRLVKHSKAMTIQSKLASSELWDEEWQSELEKNVALACPRS